MKTLSATTKTLHPNQLPSFRNNKIICWDIENVNVTATKQPDGGLVFSYELLDGEDWVEVTETIAEEACECEWPEFLLIV